MSMRTYSIEGICFIVTPKLINDILNKKTKLNLQEIADFCGENVNNLNENNILNFLKSPDNNFLI